MDYCISCGQKCEECVCLHDDSAGAEAAYEAWLASEQGCGERQPSPPTDKQ
jgi:hypothetical protein